MNAKFLQDLEIAANIPVVQASFTPANVLLWNDFKCLSLVRNYSYKVLCWPIGAPPPQANTFWLDSSSVNSGFVPENLRTLERVPPRPCL